MRDLLSRPRPSYVAGPLIGLVPGALLLIGNRVFGLSSTLRHGCAAIYPRGIAHFRYDSRREGAWNLAFSVGILAGGFIAGVKLRDPPPVDISTRTGADLLAMGIRDFSGLVPHDLFRSASLLTLRGWAVVVLGGYLVGFGTAYAGGCTSGHGISGVANLQRASFIALASFFVGGLIGTFVLLPALLRL